MRVFGHVLAVMILLLVPMVGHAALCVNEVMADPASDWDGDQTYNFRDDEWVEIYNAGPGHVDLHEYLLSDDNGLWTYGFDEQDGLAVGEARVIYGSQSLVWQQANGHSSYGFSMSNDGELGMNQETAGRRPNVVLCQHFHRPHVQRFAQ